MKLCVFVEMEANGGDGMSGRMLNLEMPFQHHHHHHHHQLLSYPTHDTQSVKQNPTHPCPITTTTTTTTTTKAKQQQLSDEDEPGEDGKRKSSPWQRMKWTDNMVRLLIMVVFYIGDDCNIEANSNNDSAIKKKIGGVIFQRKGKWKSVSSAMMEKGFYVSPQQCEDKFNDLNKRYKRVNDVLGRGTACRVVENQSLLDTMEHLTPKMKEEVKKLLNSKHLFFREMCAYHSSGGAVGGGQSSEAMVEMSPSCHQYQQQQVHQHCFHSSGNGNVGANSRNVMESEGLRNMKGGREVVDVDGDEDDDGEDDDEDDGDGDEDEEGTEVGSAGGRLHENNCHDIEMVSNKRQRREMFSSPTMRQMSCELVSVLQDGTKNPWEQRQWMMSRMIQLEEQRVSYQCQTFELEKQRLKWTKFSAKKEREMERMKLNNERMRLENERMVLLLRKKELELLHYHHQQSSNKRPEPSSMAG